MSTTMNTSTRENCPLHIWKHEVVMAAIHMGSTAETCVELNDKIVFWYNSGEPVWMAAESLAFVSKRRTVEARADKEVDGLRSCIMNAIKNGEEK